MGSGAYATERVAANRIVALRKSGAEEKDRGQSRDAALFDQRSRGRISVRWLIRHCQQVQIGSM